MHTTHSSGYPEKPLAPAQNHLIERLPPRDRARLLDACEPVQLKLAQVLDDAGCALRHVYFPVEGFISLVARVDEHPGLEVGMVGREGMVGTALVLGVPCAPSRSVVQGAGASWRMSAVAFRRELKASTALQQQLALYLYVLMAQTVSSAGCLRFHLVSQRLARWLLMSQDRAHHEHFHVTHEFLAYMLGVRRVGVTVAAGELQRRGLIHYHRGELTVVDRPGLEAAACSCYAADRTVYQQHLG